MTPEWFICQVSELVRELTIRRYFNLVVDSEVISLDLIIAHDI